MGASRRVTFCSGQLSLEGILQEPERAVGNAGADEGPQETRAAIVCHPHPLYGGNMHSAVVVAVCDELTNRGWTVLRFNFRGVGNSQGGYGGPERARDDAATALDFLVDTSPRTPRSLAMVGYSFGAYAALAAGNSENAIHSAPNQTARRSR